jgi:hypothetical protein
MPAPLTENWNLIARPIIPLVSAPVPRSDRSFDREGGLGDIAFQAFVSPRPKGGLTWVVGGLLSHVQSYAGADDRSDVSLTAF